MKASLNEKLMTVKWGKYRIDELFESQPVKHKLCKGNLSNSFKYPAYSSEIENNGIIGYTNNPEFICNEETPTFVLFGDHTRTFNIASKNFSVLDNVKVLKPKTNSINTLLFITAVWKKQIPNLGYARHWKIAQKCVLLLPVNDENTLNIDFMDSFIEELEAERVAELSTYLTACGLNSCELTDGETDSICNFSFVRWKKYRMGDLFERIKTNKLPYLAKGLPEVSKEQYVLPCLTSSFQNQGLNYYAPREGATILKNVISIPSNSDVYRAYFQSRDFTVLSDAYAIRWKYSSKDLTPKQYLFMVRCINKVTDRPIYSHKNKLGGWNVVKNMYLQLPQVNGEIDLDYMETLISAVQKLVIKDVVLYADKKIDKAKEVLQ